MKERILYLGDIHGSFNIINQYVKLYGIKDAHIIQVGDFGVGFQTIEKEKRMLEMFNPILVKNNVHVWAIRGNHDYKPHFDNDPFGLSNIHLIPDYTVLELCGKEILCIGGAVSVDRHWRYTKNQRSGIFENQTLGVESWWPDEVFVLDRDKIGEIVVGEIHHIRHKHVILLDGKPPCLVMVHSANAVGSGNIMGLINNYKHIHGLSQDCARWQIKHTITHE